MSNFPPDSFEAWMRRPVYVTQCKTAAAAAKLGVRTPKLRLLPAYRDAESKEGRMKVAQHFKSLRKWQHRERCVLKRLAEVERHDPKTGYLVNPTMAYEFRTQLAFIRQQLAAFH